MTYIKLFSIVTIRGKDIAGKSTNKNMQIT